jgi:protocatechuate 3,4-dioxygenase beta subunit
MQSTEQDINFRLTGFTVTGHVTSDNCNGGPADIQVEIPGVASTHTDSNGHFSLPNVPPGSYTLRASHPHYSFQTVLFPISQTHSQFESEAKVEWGNVVISRPFVIRGYSISGTVQSGGEPLRNVEFWLYSNTSSLRCELPPSTETVAPAQRPICVATSNEKGKFTFKDVPCGRYKLQPFYTTFDVIPKEKFVEVTSGNVEIAESFVVKGFSLSGRVISNGKGVEGVTIKVNGAKTQVTDSNGYYTLDQLSNGLYNIEASKEHLHFTSISNLRISPSMSGELPNITVKAYDICGRIYLSQLPAGISASTPRTVVLSDSNREIATATTDSNGAFCFVADSGSYQVSVSLSKQEQQLGLLVNPPFQVTSYALPILIFYSK